MAWFKVTVWGSLGYAEVPRGTPVRLWCRLPGDLQPGGLVADLYSQPTSGVARPMAGSRRYALVGRAACVSLCGHEIFDVRVSHTPRPRR